MLAITRFVAIFIFVAGSLVGGQVETFYGMLEVEEPVLLELIEAPAFQRLKNIHQYGVSYYVTDYKEEYSRYDHSLGVFAILRLKGASLEEQIAGLLHDVSHTVFSHVGDWVFGMENQEDDYQNSIHRQYLSFSGLEEILNRHGYTCEQVDPCREEFKMLEQPLPNLCADRIDYNIQGAYFQEFITYEEAQELVDDLAFVEGKWLLTRQDLAEKLMFSSIYLTRNCWGSAVNHFTSRWLADAICRAIHINLLTVHDFHFGCDEEVWQALEGSEDLMIKKRMNMLKHYSKHIILVPDAMAEFHVTFRCRAIDPWMITGQRCERLTVINDRLAEEFHNVQKEASAGWPVRIIGELEGIAPPL